MRTMQVIIRFTTWQAEAEIYDTPTGKAICRSLPVRCNANTWGDEIYFGIPVHVALEPGARDEVSAGDLAGVKGLLIRSNLLPMTIMGIIVGVVGLILDYTIGKRMI